MGRYQRHVFVCTNQRPAGHPRGCCHAKHSEQVRDALKDAVKKCGISSIVRAQQSGCLDACEHGVTVVVYPDGIWYGRVTPEDASEIIERTVMNGEVIERLLINHPLYAPASMQFPKLDTTGGIMS